MRIILLFLVFVISHSKISACVCEPLGKISKVQVDEYNVIFTGKIDSVSACEGTKSTAYFTVHQLFKGETTKNIKVNFDCVSDCRMRMLAGETWMIYATYVKYGDLRATYCGRSRKHAADVNEDDGLARSGITYEEELRFLKDTYGLQPFLEKEREVIEPLKRELIRPKGMQTVWLLLASMVGMIVIWLIVKKFFK